MGASIPVRNSSVRGFYWCIIKLTRFIRDTDGVPWAVVPEEQSDLPKPLDDIVPRDLLGWLVGETSHHYGDEVQLF